MVLNLPTNLNSIRIWGISATSQTEPKKREEAFKWTKFLLDWKEDPMERNIFVPIKFELFWSHPYSQWRIALWSDKIYVWCVNFPFPSDGSLAIEVKISRITRYVAPHSRFLAGIGYENYNASIWVVQTLKVFMYDCASLVDHCHWCDQEWYLICWEDWSCSHDIRKIIKITMQRNTSTKSQESW